MKKINITDFKFENDFFYPKLFLGVDHSRQLIYCPKCKGVDKIEVYDFISPEARLIDHQSAGLGCNHIYLQGFFFDFRPKYAYIPQVLDEKYYDTSLGCFGNSLDNILEYEGFLKTIINDSAGCQNNYENLEESVYPLDINLKLIKNLIVDKNKVLKNINKEENLNKLIKFKDKFESFCGCMGRWKCFLLTLNSD